MCARFVAYLCPPLWLWFVGEIVVVRPADFIGWRDSCQGGGLLICAGVVPDVGAIVFIAAIVAGCWPARETYDHGVVCTELVVLFHAELMTRTWLCIIANGCHGL